MSTEIIKVLNDLSSRFGIAVDWTSQNVLPYIQHLIGRIQTYNITAYTILTICMTAIIAAALIWFVKLYKRHKDDKYYVEMSAMEVIINVILGVVGTVALIILPIAIYHMLQSIFIPELAVINEITSLLK